MVPLYGHGQGLWQRSDDLGVRISKQDSCNINVLIARFVPYQYSCSDRRLAKIDGYSMPFRSFMFRAVSGLVLVVVISMVLRVVEVPYLDADH